MSSLTELKRFVNSSDDNVVLKKLLRVEIGFQKMMHPVAVKERGHLYKMNLLTVEQLVENLTILLDGDIDSFEGKEVALFPTKEDIMDILTKTQPSNDVDYSDVSGCNIFTPQQPLAIVWDHVNGKRYWCVGFFLREDDEDCVQVDHLEQKSTKGLNQWVRPERDDIQNVELNQLLPCNVQRHWDFSKSRQPVYILENFSGLESVFNI